MAAKKPGPGTRKKATTARKKSTSSKKPKAPAASAGRQKAGKASGSDFPIVGIGASAGGLEAFEQFFTYMPPDSGMAFVLVQ
ncbi:MAG: chemotaxis protein CheB, partial [Deltaproteobacteria bacterium]